jgi:hypothetical protein
MANADQVMKRFEERACSAGSSVREADLPAMLESLFDCHSSKSSKLGM